MKPKPCVHVVDDDPAMAQSLALLIEVIGFDVHTYASAPEFLQAYEPTSPECLVLDIRLPGMSGLELQQRLAESGRTLPTIFMTGQIDAGIEAKAITM